MANEIERKFLVKNTDWKHHTSGELFRQGYLNIDSERTVRVRIVGEKGFLTIKGKTKNITRAEYEYEIPVADASNMLDTLCFGPQIQKIRYRVSFAGQTWEVDEFLGDNTGLIVAEIELDSEDQKIEFPEWIGEEVSNDPRYYNSNLTVLPFNQWQAPLSNN
ncbi:inorganic triphosphatase [mine drainage metagenome]|uniref:Inorganic triphosphatase n=1 Tax=mine drainage metagenome TaxID=410659 RepID=A0A1J5SE19_9ZZZZ